MCPSMRILTDHGKQYEDRSKEDYTANSQLSVYTKASLYMDRESSLIMSLLSYYF